MSNLIPSPTTTVRQVFSEMKPAHLIVGGIVLVLTAGIVARLLPGAARWAGLNARPIHPMQINWPSPFGLRPILPSLSAMMPMASPMAALSNGGRTQEQLGQAIVAATTQSVGDNLQGILSGQA